MVCFWIYRHGTIQCLLFYIWLHLLSFQILRFTHFLWVAIVCLFSFIYDILISDFFLSASKFCQKPHLVSWTLSYHSQLNKYLEKCYSMLGSHIWDVLAKLAPPSSLCLGGSPGPSKRCSYLLTRFGSCSCREGWGLKQTRLSNVSQNRFGISESLP